MKNGDAPVLKSSGAGVKLCHNINIHPWQLKWALLQCWFIFLLPHPNYMRLCQSIYSSCLHIIIVIWPRSQCHGHPYLNTLNYYRTTIPFYQPHHLPNQLITMSYPTIIIIQEHISITYLHSYDLSPTPPINILTHLLYTHPIFQ